MAQVEWKRDDMAVVRCSGPDEASQLAKRILADLGRADADELMQMWPLIYRDGLTIHYADGTLFVWHRGDRQMSDWLERLVAETEVEMALF